MSSGKNKFIIKEFSLCDREHFLILKGISILVILIALFCESFLNIPHGKPVVSIAAAVFVLCSGFGVAESFRRKGSLIHYWENKMIKVWIPSVVIVVGLTAALEKNMVSWISQSPVGLKGSWLHLIFGEYAAFWLVFRMVKNRNARLICLFLCSAAAFALLPETLDIKPHVFAFPVGVLLSQIGWKYKVMKAGWGKKILLLALCLAAAAVGGIIAALVKIPYAGTLAWSVCTLAAALSLLLVTYYLQKIPVLGVFAPFGMISYAIYLTYDRVFALFAGQKDWRMYVALVAVVFVVAAVVAWLRQQFINWNQKMRRKNRAHLKGSME